VHLAFARERVGEVSTEMLTHALQSLAVAARATLHVDGACVCAICVTLNQ
jgi:imidazoleglycerol phosphate dehydratase HisB